MCALHVRYTLDIFFLYTLKKTILSGPAILVQYIFLTTIQLYLITLQHKTEYRHKDMQQNGGPMAVRATICSLILTTNTSTILDIVLLLTNC